MKVFSKVLCAIYVVFVIVILLFGNGLVSKTTKLIRTRLIEKKEITDVSVRLEESELLAGKYYYPKYTPIGDITGDAGLVYTSMNPRQLVVSANGAICAKNSFEGESIKASVKITSKYDKTFQKIITYQFVKKYPEEFNVRYFIKGHSFDTTTLYVGVPVYVYPNVLSSNSSYNCTDYEVAYNKDYFKKAADGALIPKCVTAEGEDLNFVVTYGNGATAVSKKFVIKEPEFQAADIDEIKINNLVGNTIENVRGEPLVITFFKQGEPVATDYSLTFEKKDDVSKSASGNYFFKTPGDKKVTLTLPNGYSTNFLIKVRNSMSAPIFEDTGFQKSHYITMLDTQTKHLKFHFEEGVTYTTVKYTFNKKAVGIVPDSNSVKITPKKAGVTTIKMILDDGFSKVEESYTIEVKKDMSKRAILLRHINNWVPKLLGHGGLFFILAFFAMNMFKYINIENKYVKSLCYLLTGFSIALITEFVQRFIPSRSGRIVDIILDMGAFLLGTLCVLFFRFIKNNFSLDESLIE